MKSYQFGVIIDESPQSEAEILDMADALGNAGCLDRTVCGHREGVEVVFDRDAESLQHAMHFAVTAIENAGYKVKRVELERESITAETQYELVTLPEVFGFGRFVVPSYQRSYSWESEQRKDLLDDLVNIARLRQRGQDQRHFTGTIVAARPTGGDGEALEIVDGQQRLTSLVILIAELLRRPELAQRTITWEGKQVPVQEVFLNRIEGPGRTVRPLLLNTETDEFFKSVVLENCPQLQDAASKGHSNLADAQREFRSWVNRLGPEGPLTPEAALDAVLHGMGFLFYAPARSNETGLMFEVINNRGKPLSQLEKVKNYLVYFATRHGTTELDDTVRQAWPHILKDLSDAQLVSNQDEDSFLRAAWIVYAYPGKSESHAVYAGLKALWPPEDAACWQPLTQFVKFLQGAARSVRELRTPTQKGVLSPEEDVLTDLSCQRSHASVLPLVLAIYARVQEDPTERVRLLRLVEKLNFRHYGLPVAKRSDTGQGDLFWWAHQFYDKWSSTLEGARGDSGWLEERLTSFVRDRAPDVELVKALPLDHDEGFDYYSWGSLN